MLQLPGFHTVQSLLDDETAGHCQHVARSAVRFADELGLTRREREFIRIGALMHDVGKVAVPLDLLTKATSLSATEWLRIREHSEVGERIVAAMGLPEVVQQIVRHHHERWDGTGYPDGLVGGEIPLYARIVCIVDVFDALGSERSYHAPLSVPEALDYMERQEGTLFDPELLRVFLAGRLQRTPAVHDLEGVAA